MDVNAIFFYISAAGAAFFALRALFTRDVIVAFESLMYFMLCYGSMMVWTAGIKW